MKTITDLETFKEVLAVLLAAQPDNSVGVMESGEYVLIDDDGAVVGCWPDEVDNLEEGVFEWDGDQLDMPEIMELSEWAKSPVFAVVPELAI